MIKDLSINSPSVRLAEHHFANFLYDEMKVELGFNHQFYKILRRYLQAAYSEGFNDCLNKFTELQFTMDRPTDLASIVNNKDDK